MRRRARRRTRRFASRASCRAGHNQLDDATRKALAAAMTGAGGAESNIPSGFTYLGQFIDHDLTMDTTKKALGDPEPPFKMLQGRSPALDLDSLYGRGPTRIPRSTGGQHPPAGGLHRRRPGRGTRFDLPEARDTHPSVGIPDPRNDENLAVAQTHLAFIRFHNRVVDALAPGVPHGVLFSRSRNNVVRHYQWMMQDRLSARICQIRRLWTTSLRTGGCLREANARADAGPDDGGRVLVAAFRLGHSMVREEYQLEPGTSIRASRRTGRSSFLFNLLGHERRSSTNPTAFRRSGLPTSAAYTHFE